MIPLPPPVINCQHPLAFLKFKHSPCSSTQQSPVFLSGILDHISQAESSHFIKNQAEGHPRGIYQPSCSFSALPTLRLQIREVFLGPHVSRLFIHMLTLLQLKHVT